MPAAPELPAGTVAESVLAFDVGSRRIGVAVGQRLTGDGRPLTVIIADSHAKALTGIAPLIATWRPQVLLVGRPLTLDGNEQPASERARGLARALRLQFGLPVIEVDERSTSKIAARRFAEARRDGRRRRSDADDLDADAAAVLVDRYYDAPDSHLPCPP